MSSEDFKSLVVTDPDLVDPEIDVSGLKTQTDTDPRLLGSIPDLPGIKYDPTSFDYLRDLNELFAFGLPTVETDQAQIPGAMDTLVDTGGSGGDMDQVTGSSVLDTPTAQIPGAVDTLINVGGGADMGTLPATTVTTPTDTSIAIEDLTQPSNVGDFQITAASPLTNQTQITDPVTPIQDLPMVTTSINRATGEVFDAQTGEKIGNLYDEVALTGTGTPEQQDSFLQNVLGRAGQTVEGALNELGKVPGAVVDFANQTVDVFGRKLNVGRTLAAAAINKVVGGPISLVFDALGAIKDTPEQSLTRSIVSELQAEKNYGFNMGNKSIGQDIFGRNPVSAFGDYEDTLLNDATSTGTTKIDLAKKEFAQDYFDKKAGKTAPQEDIGSIPGDTTPGSENIVDEFAPSDIQVTDSSLEIPDRGRGDVSQDTGSVSTAEQAGPPSQRGGGADMGSAAANEAAAAAQDAARGSYGGPPSQGGGGGSSGGGGKIVCTMMNESYGFGSFRNKIWLRHSKGLAPEYQKGYHKIFLPLVRLSKKNIVLKKILEHIAVHRTIDIRQESRGKVHLLGRVYRKILEPICYWVGKHG